MVDLALILLLIFNLMREATSINKLDWLRDTEDACVVFFWRLPIVAAHVLGIVCLIART